jgi:DNA-binding NarL/FixJ family response regulator
MTSRRIRILCVDDHAFVVEGLKARLALEQDMEVVGWVTAAADVVGAVQRHAADMVLLDIELPGTDAFEVLDDLRRRCGQVKTLMLSAYVRDRYIDAALRGGAWGYLSKSDDPEALIEAIRKVWKGQFAMGPRVLERCQRAVETPRSSAAPASKLGLLSPRELQVLTLIAKGMSRLDIAQAIHRSPKTVDNHRAAIMQKLGIRDRVELARFALSEGLAELE